MDTSKNWCLEYWQYDGKKQMNKKTYLSGLKSWVLGPQLVKDAFESGLHIFRPDPRILQGQAGDGGGERERERMGLRVPCH